MREHPIHFGQPPADTPAEPKAVKISGETPEERIVSAIRTVYDPEIPVNLYDLGLIYAIDIDGDRVDIKMTLTAPGCPVAGTLPGLVENAVRQLDEFDEIRVELVWEPPWSQEMMSDEARLELGLL